MKDMQDYNLKEKLNKQLLNIWKEENYVRQLKKIYENMIENVLEHEMLIMNIKREI